MNGFPYLEEDDNRPQKFFDENVVMRKTISKSRSKHHDGQVAFKTHYNCRRGPGEKFHLTPSQFSFFETKILKYNRCIVTIYQGKRHKNVLLLSTLHDNLEVDSNHLKKEPETVTFYNSTEYGVDVSY